MIAVSDAATATLALACTWVWSTRSITARTSVAPDASATCACHVWKPSPLVAGVPFTLTCSTFWPSVVPRAVSLLAVVAPEIGKIMRSAAGGAGGSDGPRSAGG